VVLVSQPGLIAVNLIIAALCFASIFLFKNRKLQKRLSSSLMISTAAFVILLSASSAELMKSVPAGNVEGSLSWGLVMPALAIVFLLLANRGINKDEELIKSADRLR
jgi:Ca2+/Na+ antiporter